MKTKPTSTLLSNLEIFIFQKSFFLNNLSINKESSSPIDPNIYKNNLEMMRNQRLVP